MIKIRENYLNSGLGASMSTQFLAVGARVTFLSRQDRQVTADARHAERMRRKDFSLGRNNSLVLLCGLCVLAGDIPSFGYG
jgi:hypothetical protein